MGQLQSEQLLRVFNTGNTRTRPLNAAYRYKWSRFETMGLMLGLTHQLRNFIRSSSIGFASYPRS